jgi:hypothetical protein
MIYRLQGAITRLYGGRNAKKSLIAKRIAVLRKLETAKHQVTGSGTAEPLRIA